MKLIPILFHLKRVIQIDGAQDPASFFPLNAIYGGSFIELILFMGFAVADAAAANILMLLKQELKLMLPLLLLLLLIMMLLLQLLLDGKNVFFHLLSALISFLRMVQCWN